MTAKQLLSSVSVLKESVLA